MTNPPTIKQILHTADGLKEPMRTDCDIICPFCNEADFDLIGLKIHLAYCTEYLCTPTSDEPEPEQAPRSENTKDMFDD